MSNINQRRQVSGAFNAAINVANIVSIVSNIVNMSVEDAKGWIERNGIYDDLKQSGDELMSDMPILITNATRSKKSAE